MNAQKIVKEALKDAENIKNEILVPIDSLTIHGGLASCLPSGPELQDFSGAAALYIDTTAQHSILGEIIGTEKKNEPTLRDIKNKTKGGAKI